MFYALLSINLFIFHQLYQTQHNNTKTMAESAEEKQADCTEVQENCEETKQEVKQEVKQEEQTPSVEQTPSTEQPKKKEKRRLNISDEERKKRSERMKRLQAKKREERLKATGEDLKAKPPKKGPKKEVKFKEPMPAKKNVKRDLSNQMDQASDSEDSGPFLPSQEEAEEMPQFDGAGLIETEDTPPNTPTAAYTNNGLGVAIDYQAYADAVVAAYEKSSISTRLPTKQKKGTGKKTTQSSSASEQRQKKVKRPPPILNLHL